MESWFIPQLQLNHQGGDPNPFAFNYDRRAEKDNNTCKFTGCTDPLANNYVQGDNIEDRKRTRGADVEYLLPGTGALNTLGFPNLSASQYQTFL